MGEGILSGGSNSSCANVALPWEKYETSISFVFALKKIMFIKFSINPNDHGRQREKDDTYVCQH